MTRGSKVVDLLGVHLREVPELCGVLQEDLRIELIGETLYVTVEAVGVELALDDANVVEAIHVYSTPPAADPLRLPLGLDLERSQAAVRAMLGPPSFERPARDVPILGPQNPMDRYDGPTAKVAVTYAADGSCIERITVMPAAWHAS